MRYSFFQNRFYRLLFILFLFVFFLTSCPPPSISLPYEVSDITVIPGDQEVILSWVEPTDQKNYSHTSIFWGIVKAGQKKLDRYKGEIHSAQMRFEHLTNGEEYTFLIVCVDKKGNESQGVTRRATPKSSLSPSQVTSFRSVRGSGKITLFWDNPSNADFEKTHIWVTDFNGVLKQSFFISGEAGKESSIEISKLENGYNYHFFAKAVDRWGNSSPLVHLEANPDGTPPAGVVFSLDHLKNDYIIPKVERFYYYLPEEEDSNNPEGFKKGGQILLKWTNPPDEDFDKTEIYFSIEGLSKKFYDYESLPQHEGGAKPTPASPYQILSRYPAKAGETLGKPKQCALLFMGLENGKIYNFRLAALDLVGNSKEVELKRVMPRDGVACSPHTFDLASGNGQILVIWEAPHDEDFQKAKLYYLKDINNNSLLDPEEEDGSNELAEWTDFEEAFPTQSLSSRELTINSLTNDQAYFVFMDYFDSSGNKVRCYWTDSHLNGTLLVSEAKPITPMKNKAPDSPLVWAIRSNQKTTLRWEEPQFSNPSLNIDLTTKPPRYIIYQAELASQMILPSDFINSGYNAGADGEYGTADDGAFPPSIYKGKTKILEWGGASPTDPRELSFDSLENGKLYYFKIFVVAYKADSPSEVLFSNGRIVSCLPDLPAGFTLQDALLPEHRVQYGSTSHYYSIPMRFVPPGEMSMGIPFFAGEVHRVLFDQGYWIAQSEVSYGLWRSVYEWATSIERGNKRYTFGNEGVVSNGKEVAKNVPLWENETTLSPLGMVIHSTYDRLPVVFINWYDMIVWCNALTEMTFGEEECLYQDDLLQPYRDSTAGEENVNWKKLDTVKVKSGRKGYGLPTEAQWEYAARYVESDLGVIKMTPGLWISGDYQLYENYTEDKGSFYSWHVGNSNSQVSVVDDLLRKSNGIGCLNMSGNVSELVWDWYAPYPNTTVTNPIGPLFPDPLLKVKSHRGGAYTDPLAAQGTAFRSMLVVEKPDLRVGFRLYRPKGQ